MGKASNIMNYYFSDSKRFADLFNTVCFQGRQVVNAEELADISEVNRQLEMEKPKTGVQGRRIERIHDVCKKLKTGEVLRILTLENQELVDYSMPFRCLQYDTMEYGKQLEEIRRKNEREKRLKTRHEKLCGLRKEDRMTPVYTICLYHGEDKWDGPRLLGDMMRFAKEEDDFRRLFNDYPLRLYCLNEADDLELFQTEAGLLLQALQFREDRDGLKRLIESNQEYQHLDRDTLEALTFMLKLPTVWKSKNHIMRKNQESEEYDMCKAVREWAEEERRIGREESRTTIVRNLLRRGVVEEEIILVAECDSEYVAKVRETL